MNLIELDRALKQLRLGGMAAVLETRLRQAQAEPHGPHRPALLPGLRRANPTKWSPPPSPQPGGPPRRPTTSEREASDGTRRAGGHADRFGRGALTPLKNCWRSSCDDMSVPVPCSLPIVLSRIGGSCWGMQPRSAPYSTACCITGTCSSAALEVGEPNLMRRRNRRRVFKS